MHQIGKKLPHLPITITRTEIKSNDATIDDIQHDSELFSFASCRSKLQVTLGETDKCIYYDNAIFDFLLTNFGTDCLDKDKKIWLSMFINHVGLLDEVFNYSNKFTFYKRINKHYKEVDKYFSMWISKASENFDYNFKSNQIASILLGSHLFNVRRKYSNAFIEWLNQQEYHALLRVLQEMEEYNLCFGH